MVRCPYCRHLPLRVPLVRPWRAIAGALVVAGALIAAQPQRQPQLPSPQPAPRVAEAPITFPAQASSASFVGLVGVKPDVLMRRLAQADRAWIPRSEPLPDGRTRYVYKRRAGDPELTIPQIKALIASPPTFRRERLAIAALLAELQRVGVRVEITQPRKPGAAGEWEPAQRTIRIQPRVLGKGSLEFAKVLNHEAIHVAQSCGVRGWLRSSPRPLGLSEQLPDALAGVLQEPIYRQASAQEQRLEREAYANQGQLDLGAALVRQHCSSLG